MVRVNGARERRRIAKALAKLDMEPELYVLHKRIRKIPKSRVWFYQPAWYWFGWGTLSPVLFGHDEYARRTVVVGWTFTGRIVIALNY